MVGSFIAGRIRWKKGDDNIVAGVVSRAAVCYSLVPPTQKQPYGSDSEGKEGVDELSETLHNLTSLLLTSTTLRQDAARQYRIPFFNNQQSISVGV
jgi:hypothetical protein